MINSALAINKFDRFSPTTAKHANWLFSGEVINDNAERYHYVFQMQRDDDKYHAEAILFDIQTKQIILHKENLATISNNNTYDWQIGDIFLRFNPINTSWIFGINDLKHDLKHDVFNFKVDMLKPEKAAISSQTIKSGILFSVSQTGPLDGYIILNNNSEFVSAQKSWFRETWSRDEALIYPLKGVLCQFNDGSGFYSISTNDKDDFRSTIAGFFNSEGLSIPVSQFISAGQDLKKSKDLWNINVASPIMKLAFFDKIHDDKMAGGFISKDNKQGFCLLNKTLLG